MNITKLSSISIERVCTVLFVASLICWGYMLYAFNKSFMKGGATGFDNAVFVLARFLSYATLLAFVYMLSRTNKFRNLLIALVLILVGNTWYQIDVHQNHSRAKQDCLASVQEDMTLAAQNGRPLSQVVSSSELASCSRN